MNKKIAFVKVPKTASSAIYQGNSPEFCDGFSDLNDDYSCYIKHSLPFHYGNKTNYCAWERSEQSICSSAYKKLHDHDHVFFTQVRDPYDIACSLYFFLKRGMEKSGAPTFIISSNIDADYHNSKIIAKGASINDFLENMKHNQTYTHYYDEIKIEDFDCVGLSTEIDKTKLLLKNIFNVNVETHITNVNPNKKVSQQYSFEFSRKDFEKLNEKEYFIFNNGINKFKKLCNKYL